MCGSYCSTSQEPFRRLMQDAQLISFEGRQVKVLLVVLEQCKPYVGTSEMIHPLLMMRLETLVAVVLVVVALSQ